MSGGVWAIARVKDEADVIAATVGSMLELVDHVLVEDNASSDGTTDLLHDLALDAGRGRLIVTHDDELGYWQAAKMSRLAMLAGEMGARWIIPFDADELWRAEDGELADTLRGMPAHVSIVTAELYDHVVTGLDDELELDPTRRLTYRRAAPAPLPKVAVRAFALPSIHQGNHGADYGGTDGGLVVHHYPYRSAEQMIRKVRNGAAAYAATDLPEHVGQHWRDYGRLDDDAIRDVFRRYFHTADPTSRRAGLLEDSPWPL